MDKDDTQVNQTPKGLWQRLLHLFGARKCLPTRKRKLEPKYWPEVKDFLDAVTAIIQSHTINDGNTLIINQRIIDYIAEQINIKGSIEDINERYLALDTLADRILVNNLSKIVGLKKDEGFTPMFSNAVMQFKKQLHHRHQQELSGNLQS